MWDEIINDDLLIGQSAADLMQEIRTNTWLISMSESERARTPSSDLITFFHAVIENRREQLRQSQAPHGMWFYIWHDAQASQLRFCLISDIHQKLPFKCETIPVPLETIVSAFLQAHDYIDFVTLEIFPIDAQEDRQDNDLPPFVLPVFVIQL